MKTKKIVLGCAAVVAFVDMAFAAGERQVGRNLFVTDQCVEKIEGDVRRVWKEPVKEGIVIDGARLNAGGIWYEGAAGKYRMWYEQGGELKVSESADGKVWSEGVHAFGGAADGEKVGVCSVVRDVHAKNENERYCLINHRPFEEAILASNDYVRAQSYKADGMMAMGSDGVNWGWKKVLPPCEEEVSFFYDVRNEEWNVVLAPLAFNRTGAGAKIERYRVGGPVFRLIEGWTRDEKWSSAFRVGPWLKVDTNDVGRLEHFNAVSYERALVHFYGFGDCVKLGFSQDGRRVERKNYAAFLACEKDGWDAADLQIVGNGFVVDGDELKFYYSARKADGGYAIGRAKMRRDGFAALEGTGVVTLKDVNVEKGCVYLNVDARAGAVSVEAIDRNGKVIEGYEAEASRVEKVDSTCLRVEWKEKAKLPEPWWWERRIRVRLENAALYAVWMSDESGVSDGALAGGGRPYWDLVDRPGKRKVEGMKIAAVDEAHANKTRKHSGIPSMAVAKGGRWFATWYASPTEYEDENNYCILSSSEDGGKTWKEMWIADPDGSGLRRAFDPNVWVTPDGRLMWTWTERIGNWGSRTENDQVWMVMVDVKTGELLTEPRVIAEGIMMNKPIVLKDGTWLLPCAVWWDKFSACFYASKDGGKTFERRGGIHVRARERFFDEHVVVEKANGDLRCYVRSHYGQGNDLLVSESKDGGWTWSAAKYDPVVNINSRTFVMRLANGDWLMIKHGGIGKYLWRTDLMAFISKDEGETWQGGLLLDGRKDVAYPDGQQLEDGSIVIVNDFNRTGRREISYARFTEEDVLKGTGKVPRIVISCKGEGE